MANKYIIFALILFCMVFAGCGPSYPKDSVPVSIEKLLKKEYKLNGHAALVGQTVYLEIDLEGLISPEQKVLTEILKKVQGASLIITRVSLSSDAKIKNMVLVVNEPKFDLNLRIIQRVEDIKGFIYQKISKADYEERLILEIEPSENKPYTLEVEVSRNKDLDTKEFVGRLIVSQINMLSRSNPFLAVVLGNTQLRYIDFKENELVVGISNSIAKPIVPFFEDIVNSQASKITKKKIGLMPNKIRIIDNNNQSTIIDIKPKIK